MSDKKRCGGRPATGKRGTFTFRVTDQLRNKLELAAAEAKRPVSEEIEARLERSFDREALLAQVTAAVARGAAHRPLVQEYGDYTAPIEIRFAQ
jgi:hypothetical protein